MSRVTVVLPAWVTVVKVTVEPGTPSPSTRMSFPAGVLPASVAVAVAVVVLVAVWVGVLVTVAVMVAVSVAVLVLLRDRYLRGASR